MIYRIAIATLLGLGLTVGTACAHRREAEDAPEWSTKRGARSTKLDIAETMLDAGALEPARIALAELRDDGVDSPDLDYLQGRALAMMGLNSEAIPMLTRAAQKLSKDPRPYRTLGLVYADQKDLEPAIEALTRATKIDADDAVTWNNLGFLLSSAKRHDEAVVALRHAVARDSTNPRFRNNLGFALFQVGAVDDALRAFQSTGSDSDAFANLGLAYELNGQPDRAREEYARALTISPKHSGASDGLARLAAPTETQP